MNFTQKLKQAIVSSNSTLCVGLDPDPQKIPSHLREEYPDNERLIPEFCRRIIESTKMHVCAYKPNIAFFEALGPNSWKILNEVADMIPSDRVFIADAKRGDIGNTALKYKETFFDQMGSDAITLNPLMGMDTLKPFLDDESKAIFVLTMTSNKGAADFFQKGFQGRVSMGEFISEELRNLESLSKAHLGMVIGATQAEYIKPILKACPNAHLLIPGIGSQGGSVDAIEKVVRGHKGVPIINSSRAIIYVGGNELDWADRISQKAIEMKESISKITENYV